MASKRMFSINIMDSDAFLNLPKSAQALYVHLCMRADDDGFLGNAKRITNYVGGSTKDLELLLKKRFLMQVDDVVVVKHWRMHNTILKDRYTPTVYQDEYKKLTIKGNRSYTERKQNDDKNVNECVNKNDNTIINNADSNGANCNVAINDNTGLDLGSGLENSKNTLVHSGEMHDPEKLSLEQFYESIWKLYPLKKGKGQVSKTKKQVLQRIGYEQIKRCVDRYVTELRSSGKEKFMMHGSTFFNSGYVDYLDENYVVGEQPAEQAKESEPEDRFSCLEPDMRSLLESCGVIDGQSLDLGNATDEQIRYLQECGVL